MNKVSQELIRVDTLIPSQLLEDAEELRVFIKKYYEYMSLTDSETADNQPSYLINNVLEFRDLDASIDEFIELIRKELGQGVSSQLFVDKSNLYKFAKEIYSSKGSVESFKLIFRLLFNKEIEFRLPKEEILIASDGRWKQDVSLFAELNGDGNNLVGKRITITAPSNQLATFEVLFSRKVVNEESIYELFISKDYNAEIEVGSLISDSGITGTVVSALNSAAIAKAGEGFKVGQIYNVVNEFGSGASVKVTNVNSNGGITGIALLTFGVGYESAFYGSLVSNVNVISDPGYDISYDSGTNEYTATFNDTLGGFKDEGFISKQDYFASDYADYTYSGTVITNWSDDRRYTQGELVEDDTAAVIFFDIGALCEYSGYFESNKGFLSDAIKLQDNFYYQNFSYVITVDEKFDSYSDILKKSVHPAGMIAFGQYDIINTIDLSSSIGDVYISKNQRHVDTIAVTESQINDINKVILNTDQAYALDYFAEDYTFYPNLRDVVQITDNISVVLG